MAFDYDQTPYQDLRAIISEKANRVVVWAGAGLSVPAGIPSWGKLRQDLTAELRRKAKTLDDDGSAKALSYAENATRAKTHWEAFNILKLGLGDTSYQAAVRKSLSPAQKAALPPAYEALWRLPLAGMVTLNLDRLASRGFASVFGGDRIPGEFNSKDVGMHTAILANPHTKFIYNAHGIDDDVNSWVFTRSDLSSLLRNPAYINFINSLLVSTTVIFLGISADDAAAGGHLERLRGIGVNTTPHYWITNRNDTATDAWAENAGIRRIWYRSTDDDHSELLELLQDLATFVAEDEPIAATPVAPTQTLQEEALPSPEILRQQEPEMIRLYLNAHAQRLLAGESDEAYEAYRAFVNDYSLPIHIAWFVSTRPGDNDVLGYEVQDEAAEGAFGTVYKAQDRTGKPVAIKVLREEIRKNHNALSSFRRGVGSMKILKERNVDGMVEYIEAAEIPAMVVMEWIEGDNLRAAITSKRISTWDDIFDVAVSLAAILREAHNLPERVLHRDLRPANIMLEGLYGPKPWTVKVLDFDLSWHRGAYDNTLIHEAGTTGYLAPEQIHRVEGVSTRNSAVDAFGLGMTLYFMLTGRDPNPNGHRHADWPLRVHEACADKSVGPWRSLPSRFARLILAATRDTQSERPDVTAMYLELLRMRAIVGGATTNVSPDLLADELASRTECFSGYSWSDDQQAASVARVTGQTLDLRASEARKRIGLFFRRVETGFENRRLMNRKLGPALVEARRILTSARWSVETAQVENVSLHIVAYIRSDTLALDIQAAANSIDKVANLFSFG